MDKSLSSVRHPGFALQIYLLVFLVLLWGVTLGALFAEQESILMDAEAEVSRINQLVAGQTTSFHGELRSGLVLLDHWLAANPDADPRTDRQFLLLVESVRNSFQSPVEIRVVGMNGDLFLLGSGHPLVPESSVVDREYFRVQLSPQTWGLHVSPPVQSRVTGRWVVPFSYPVTHRNAHMVALLAAVDVEILSKFYEEARPRPEGTISILRKDGVLLGRMPLNEGDLGMSVANNPWWINRPQGAHRTSIPVKGTHWVSSFRDLPGTDLVTVVSKSFQSVLGAWKVRFLFTVGALASVSVLMGLWGLALRRNWKQLAQSEEEKRVLADELSQHMQVSDTITENSNDVISIQTIPTLAIEHMNPAMTRLRGWTMEDVARLEPRNLMGAGAYDTLRQTVNDLVQRFLDGDPSAKFGKVDLFLPHKNGSISPFEMMITLMVDHTGHPNRFLGIFRDLTDRVAQEELVRRLAFLDPLTGLPNRRLLEDRLGQALVRAEREQTRGALFFLDLDRFKPVNDSLGHAAGDWLLQEVARRIEASVRGTDTVARIGGDEFVVLLSDQGDLDQTAGVADKILRNVELPYDLDGDVLSVSASIGIVLFPDQGANPTELIRLSDAAMYQAKAQGRNRAVFFGGRPRGDA
jgi:diguanylate cyclase (GGDEF)-like protein/PAS domain S-box-containing protein